MFDNCESEFVVQMLETFSDMIKSQVDTYGIQACIPVTKMDYELIQKAASIINQYETDILP